MILIKRRKLSYIGNVTKNKRTDLIKEAYQGKTKGRRRSACPPSYLLNNITSASCLMIHDKVWIGTNEEI